MPYDTDANNASEAAELVSQVDTETEPPSDTELVSESNTEVASHSHTELAQIDTEPLHQNEPSTISLNKPELNEPEDNSTPTRSLQLGHSTRSSKTITIATDLVSLSVSLFHVVFVCIVASCNGRNIDSQYDTFKSILTTLGPLFPMVYAFVMSRSLYQAARLQLEWGSALTTLEQLMGSQTLGAAIATHFKLTTLNPLSLLILGLWAFSPLGGQSLLRLLDSKSPPNTADCIYLNLSTIGPVDAMTDGSLDVSFLGAFSVDAEVRSKPIDQWGNVKIPFLRPEALSLDSHQDEGWYKFRDGEQQSYSSLIGVPIAHLPTGNSTLSIETSYIHLECDPIERHTNVDVEKNITVQGGKEINETALGVLAKGTESFAPIYNGSWYGHQHFPDRELMQDAWTLALDRFASYQWLNYHTKGALGPFPREINIEAGQTNLLFEYRTLLTEVIDHDIKGRPFLRRISEPAIITTRCQVLQKYVESRVFCSTSGTNLRPGCIAVAQRQSRISHPPGNLSVLSNPLIFDLISKSIPMTDMSNSTLISAIGPKNPYSYRKIIGYLGEDGSGEQSFYLSRPNVDTIPASNFSESLSRVINTYYLINQVNTYQTQGVIPSLGSLLQDESFDWVVTNAAVTWSTRAYSISWPWFIASIASCLFLCFASMAGVCFAHLGKGPEVLGYVSTALRDSDIMGVPQETSQMDGDTLSRVMGKKRFRFGWKDSSYGKSAIGMGLEEDVSEL